MYKNLARLMAERNVKQNEVAGVLGISAKALYNKLRGESQFTIQEAMRLKDQFFPDEKLEHLFEEGNADASAPYLGGKWKRLAIEYDGKEIAVVTTDLITTAGEEDMQC